jgi:hypothetical protein
VAPPSTRSSFSAMPESAAMASISSALWNAIASSAARAMCARFVPRVMPTSVPRARGSQYGAPRPDNAGTKNAPPLSGTLAANASTSLERSMMPSPSRSHWIAAPAMKTLPSSAYAVEPPRFHATVASRRFRDAAGRPPVFMSRKQPVP